jgi:hypothetical protein
MVFLTNIDLIKAAQKYNIPLNGVFSKNEPPQELYPGGYIINLEDSHNSAGAKLPGSHWVSFWIEPGRKNQVVYFDSFGFPPSLNTQDLLREFVPYKYNTVQIQNVNSGICGYYGLFFVWWMHNMSKKYPNLDERFERFLKKFNLKNPEKNRAILQKLLEILT